MSTARRKPGPAPRLDREQIVAAARGQIEALSMRRVAEFLGVSATAIYNYFPDRDALVSAILEDIAAELILPQPDVDWRSWLTAFAHALRDLLVANPIMMDPTTWRNSTNASLGYVYAAIDVLTAAGFTSEDARSVYLLVTNTASTSALSESLSNDMSDVLPDGVGEGSEAFKRAAKEFSPAGATLFAQHISWIVAGIPSPAAVPS